jgi:hypothetical protein
MLYGYTLSQVLQIKFSDYDQHHQGTIQQWVVTTAGQLKDYIRSPQVTKRVLNEGLKLRAHFVIVVASRHILLWDMDNDGNLAEKPRLVGMTSTWDREKVRIGS